MTASTKEYKAPADRQFFMEYSGKSIRLVNGAGVLARSPFIMEHFYGKALDVTNDEFVVTSTGTTGADVPWAILANDPGGAASSTTGSDTDAGTTLAGTSVSWKPSTCAVNGLLTLEARVKVVTATTATDGEFFIGFADAVTYTNDVAYKMSATSTFTTSAPSDFVGFGYSGTPTSGSAFASPTNPIFGVSSVAGTDTVVALSSNGGIVARDSSYHIYRIEVGANGDTDFYIDDVHKGSMAVAVTATTALTPFINAKSLASVAKLVTVTVDYIYVRGDLGY